jgi:hypothetical protein
MPEFPPHLWKDILANRLIDFGHLVDHKQTHALRYDDAVDLGNGIEIFLGANTRSKTKLLSDGQWSQAWDLYAEAVVWAYPHRNAELQTYRRHIVRRFNATGAVLTIEYDQAARKFFHTNPQFSFNNIGELQDVLHDVYLRGNADSRQTSKSGGVGEGGTAANRASDGGKSGSKKRKRAPGDYPVCREFNRTDGCR